MPENVEEKFGSKIQTCMALIPIKPTSKNSQEINHQILSQLFRVGGNHESWLKDAFEDGELKLIRSHVKSDVRTISWGFMFCSYVCL